MVDAVVKDNIIVCGKCGHIIAKCKELRMRLGHGVIYILCKHKDGSKKPSKCGEVNRIEL